VPEDFQFAGFSSPTYTQIPDEFIDYLAPRLTEAELRVGLYILRRTFGFKKLADAISLNQLIHGITTTDGRVLDLGTGLSRQGVMRGLKGLLQKGIITVEKRTAEDGVNQVNIYAPRFREGVVYFLDYGRHLSRPPLVNEVDPQQTEGQQTDEATNSLDDSTDSTDPGPRGGPVKEPMDMSSEDPSRPMGLAERLAWQERMDAQERHLRRLRPKPPP
jgi:hypothetical protein